MSKYISILLGKDEFDRPTILGHEFTDKPADDKQFDKMVAKAANGGLSVEVFTETFGPVVKSIELS